MSRLEIKTWWNTLKLSKWHEKKAKGQQAKKLFLGSLRASRAIKNTSPPSGFKFLTQALDLRFSIFPRAISPSKFIGVICVSQNKLWALTIIRLIIWTMKWTLGFDTPLKILSFCRWNFLIADRCLHKQRNKEILQYYESN